MGEQQNIQGNYHCNKENSRITVEVKMHNGDEGFMVSKLPLSHYAQKNLVFPNDFTGAMSCMKRCGRHKPGSTVCGVVGVIAKCWCASC